MNVQASGVNYETNGGSDQPAQQLPSYVPEWLSCIQVFAYGVGGTTRVVFAPGMAFKI